MPDRDKNQLAGNTKPIDSGTLINDRKLYYEAASPGNSDFSVEILFEGGGKIDPLYIKNFLAAVWAIP